MTHPRNDQDSGEHDAIEEVGWPPTRRLVFARRVGQLHARIRFERDELVVHVSNRLKLRDAAARRNETLRGRLYNKLAGEDPDAVVLDGIVIIQLFEIIGEDPPAEVRAASRYRVGHADLRRWYEAAVEALSPTRPRRARRSRRPAR